MAAIASVVTVVLVARRSEAFAAAERQRAAFNAVAEWRRDVRGWSAEAIDVLSEAVYLCSSSVYVDAFDKRSVTCRYRLSALIDQGRFFFPNMHGDRHGTHKPQAYRGLRHSALDPLVAAERVLSGSTVGDFESQSKALVAMKREFVSSIHRVLDPENHNREVGRMIREAHEERTEDHTLGGLLPDDQTIPLGADNLLWRRG